MASRLDPNDPRPIKIQIADALRDAYRPSEKLPTVAELADMWGVAKETARAALKELQSEGFVVTWQGKGTFYATEKPADDPASGICERLSPMVDQIRTLNDRVDQLLAHILDIERRLRALENS